MPSNSELKIVINAVNNAQHELDAVKSSLGGVEKSTKQADKSFGMMATNVIKQAGLMSAAAVGVGVAIKKGFDFGKKGAVIDQTRESFERLGLSLDDMRKATNYTVDDMTLMSGALNLAAGASKQMQDKLLEANPMFLQ